MLCTRVKLNTDHADTTQATPGDVGANDTLEDIANDAGAENNLKCCHEIGLDEWDCILILFIVEGRISSE